MAKGCIHFFIKSIVVKLYTYFFLAVLFFSCSQKDINKTGKKSHSPKVVTVYPTTDTLPENLLRFYVQFSKSMKTINNLENIKLLNEKGDEIKGAIFNNVYELWDSEQRQLTLILDPARVKSGLIANETLGRALEPNKHFQLKIEKAEDIYGNQLKEAFVKDFLVKKADTIMPNIHNWTVIPPKSNGKSPLQIIFPQVLDRLSLFNQIRLYDDTKKQIIEGKIEVINQEKEWRFIPKKKWKKGAYTLLINSRLEDPAGNNLNGLFDHQIGSLKSDQEGKVLELKITIHQ